MDELNAEQAPPDQAAPAAPEGPSTEVSDAGVALVELLTALAGRGDPRACAREAGEAAAAFSRLGSGWKLQVVPPVLFIDGGLAVPAPEQLVPLRQASTLLDVAGIGVIQAAGDVDGDHWLAFADAVLRASRGDTSALAGLAGGALRCGRHPAARPGGDPKQFDVEVFAATQLDVAAETAGELAAPNVAWDWARATAAMRRVEQAHGANAAACLRALEIRPDPPSGQVGAVSMALHAMRTLQIVKAGAATRRAVAHAGYAIGAHGLLHGVGRSLKDAAAATFEDLMAGFAPVDGVAPVATEHQARVMALIGALAADTVVMSALSGPLPLLRILYELERHRLEADNQRRSLTDGLAFLLASSDQGFDGRWLGALARSAGHVPIGTSARLADGMVGIVADPGKSGHPLKPLVMHGKGFVAADQPIQVLPW